MAHTNRLVRATSPYLLQHAHNPVDWYEWGAEALEKAKKDDKPLLVSIGYSSCHWCHVMERESFESQEIAQVMNDFFVCIKVDREERPDIDQIYMEAVQALGVHGGWPLNVFMTPDQKPFFGGTYFTPQAWVQVLTNIHRAFTANRQQLEETGDQLSMHLAHSDVSRFVQNGTTTALIPDIKAMYAALEKHFDKEWGGMDRAPKFVMPSVWRFLLRYYYLTDDTMALAQVQRTLDKVAEGGIYDQLRGGFARYAVDGYWFAPHFEKMLYDNGQLFSLYAEAYAITRDESYKMVVYESFEWLTAEMTHADGGFFSALDADSEGDEGKYYVWTWAELQEVLGPDADIISAYFQATPSGNWEQGNNILNRKGRDDDFLKQKKITAHDWQRTLQTAKEKLLHHRGKRVRPGLDDKILTAWNAITVIGLMDAYAAFSDQRFAEAAQRNMRFILSHMAEGEILYRSFKGKRSSTMGFLDDYAFTIQALIKLYQGTFDESWISKADVLTTYALEHFYDADEKFFYYTSNAAEKLISRKKEIFDNVIPSSNAVMAQNLYGLGTIMDREDWKQLAEQMTSSLSDLIRSEPNYMSQWAIAVTEIKKGFKEVLLVGKGIASIRAELHREFLPYILIQGTTDKSTLPLFEGKGALDGKDTIYVCEQKTCQLPVHSLEEARKQIRG